MPHLLGLLGEPDARDQPTPRGHTGAVASRPARGPSGGGDLQCLCSRTFKTEHACWTLGCPRPGDPGVQVPRTLLVTWHLHNSSLFWHLSALSPASDISAPHSQPFWNLGKISLFPVCSAGSARTQLPPSGGWAPSHLTAPCDRPPPALALNPCGLMWAADALASAPGFREDVEAAFGSPSAPYHPKGCCLQCGIVGRRRVRLPGTEAQLPCLLDEGFGQREKC